MKKRDLIKKIALEAKGQGVGWTFVRYGAKHDVYQLGSEIIPIPRTTEIKEPTAEGIFKECSPELGQGWWRP